MLSDHERRLLLTQRVGHLATADSRAIPHVVPVCFTISQGTLYITLDEKPKRVAGPALKRVRNIERNPMVAIVVDRYDEDWTRLGWVMLRGRAEILRAGTEHDRAQELLRSRYRQLETMQIAERPVIAVRLERVTSWATCPWARTRPTMMVKPRYLVGARKVWGTSRPSALAVFKLMTNSNLVGACKPQTLTFSSCCQSRERAAMGKAIA